MRSWPVIDHCTGLTCRAVTLAALLALCACGGSSDPRDSNSPGDPSEPVEPDPPGEPSDHLPELLRELATAKGLGSAFASHPGPISPDQDAGVHLGMLLFFSRTLSGGYDVACASCHLPDLGGGDALSLPIGTPALQPHIVGPGREVDPSTDLDPNADLGPNVPRNSQTILNVALYNQSLFHDGRLHLLPAGQGGGIRTPESGNAADPAAGESLLVAQGRFPLVSNREMRGFRYPSLTEPEDYRQFLVQRLRGHAETDLQSPEGPDNWLTLFRSAFGDGEPEQVITLRNMQKALADYQQALTFVDTPWLQFLMGDDDALTEQAVEGALLFFEDTPEGLGCHACHSGDRFTNEAFFNVGFPQIGRGRRADGNDFGRWNVSTDTRTSENMYAFRVPSLLNVSVRAPFGHAGTFQTLDDLLDYHAEPESGALRLDDYLFGLDQFTDVASLYPERYARTQAALDYPSFQLSVPLLPGRALDDAERAALVAFLQSLTDPCVADPHCMAAWIPDAKDDPDGNTLIPGEQFTPPAVVPPDAYPDYFALQMPARAARQKPANTECPANLGATNAGTSSFLRRDQQLGLTAQHGFSEETWLTDTSDSSFPVDTVMSAGGVSVGYLTESCWPDIVFAGGDASGVVIYRNLGYQQGFEADSTLFATGEQPGASFITAGFSDLTGDYYQELLLGNLFAGHVLVYGLDEQGRYRRQLDIPMSRNTFSMSFGDATGNGYPDIYFSHWSLSGLPGTAPALFHNLGDELRPADAFSGTDASVVTQNWNFAANFADLNDNGVQDLVIASDFQTSMVMENQGDGTYQDVTDRQIIVDRNGMGSVLGDFNNNGKLDWFVTSIDLPGSIEELVQFQLGNKLYMNVSDDQVRFQRSDVAGIEAGGWGWAACAADFNNNGWLDIFHTGGFGHIPPELRDGQLREYLSRYDGFEDLYLNQRPRLFINNGDGTFTESAEAWGLEPSDGRGVVCFDYDRDGDVDILLVDHSVGLQFYENQTGSGPGHRFLNLRLVGEAPNTDALGARVYVGFIDGAGQPRTRMRQVEANSSFSSQGLKDIHFGLGDADKVSLTVRWPDGAELQCEDIAANQFLVMDQQAGPGACP